MDRLAPTLGTNANDDIQLVVGWMGGIGKDGSKLLREQKVTGTGDHPMAADEATKEHAIAGLLWGSRKHPPDVGQLAVWQRKNKCLP